MPSKSQKQADAMEHASHDEDYSRERKIPMDVARGFNGEDIREGLWGKAEDSLCARIIDVDGEERVCGFTGPRPWAAAPPEPPPIEDEDLPAQKPDCPHPGNDGGGKCIQCGAQLIHGPASEPDLF